MTHVFVLVCESEISRRVFVKEKGWSNKFAKKLEYSSPSFLFFSFTGVHVYECNVWMKKITPKVRSFRSTEEEEEEEEREDEAK